MDEPLVSVGIPTYNNSSGLERLLESLVHQSYPNIEIIISNDSPNDVATSDVIHLYSGLYPHIKSYTQQINIGVSLNFRFTKKQSTGKYFMYAQDDDQYSPDVIKSLVDLLEQHPDYPCAVCKSRYIDSNGYDTSMSFTMKNLSLYSVLYSQEASIAYMALWRRDVIVSHEMKPDTPKGGDMVLIAKILFMYGAIGVSEYGWYSKGSDTRKHVKKFKNDPLYLVRLYVYAIKYLMSSDDIPLRLKMLLPVVALTNFYYLCREMIVSVVMVIPNDNILRKVLKSARGIYVSFS